MYIPYLNNSVLEEHPGGDEARLIPPLLPLLDVAVPEPIVVVEVVQRHLALIHLLHTHAPVVSFSVRLPVEVSHARLRFGVHLVLFNVQIGVVKLLSLLISICCIDTCHHFVH